MKRIIKNEPEPKSMAKYYLSIFLAFSLILPLSSNSVSSFFVRNSLILNEFNLQVQKYLPDNQSIKEFNNKMLFIFKETDLTPYSSYVDDFAKLLNSGVEADSSDLMMSCYYIGTYYLKSKNFTDAFYYLNKAEKIFQKLGIKTEKYALCLYNIGNCCIETGDLSQAKSYFLRSNKVYSELFGESNSNLVDGLSGISISDLRMRNYEESIENINLAFRIVQKFPESFTSGTMALLFETKGVANISIANYEQARFNLEKAESYYTNEKSWNLNFANILSNLGTAYHFLGQKEKSYLYYEKALKLFPNDFSISTLNLIHNYAIILGNDKQTKKGESLFEDLINRFIRTPQFDQRNYCFILRTYADYLQENKLNNEKAIRLYSKCFDYVRSHPLDKEMRDNVILGYSLSLLQKGEYIVALDSIQTLLFAKNADNKIHDPLINPEPGTLRYDGRTIEILNTKYKILSAQYKRDKKIELLDSAAKTSELLIKVLEKIRINIGEEGSRILLGDKYRNSYLDVIRCLDECYVQTKDPTYLERAFEASEKSKVASLLASTREMKAIQNHIPADLAEKEKELQRNIGSSSSKIADEENQENPDEGKLAHWKNILREALDHRDSLKYIFEKRYPEYYSLKYNTDVVSIGKISGLIGNGNNYLSYVMSDTILYTFIANNKFQRLVSQKIDTSFLATVIRFRKILTSPDMDVNSKNEFQQFQIYGYNLYSILIEPVKKYLISDELIISPDNLLSYIPFETFITSKKIKDDMIYWSLPYLMDDFTISYTYSATLLAENEKVRPVFSNKSIVFAPSYSSYINIDSISNLRQISGGSLKPLPYAKDEALLVSSITGGQLFQDSLATVSAYKNLAGKFDIIHLAMHTLINNQTPVQTNMLFSNLGDSPENYGLNIFDIYQIPLSAKMVVLSSCNTGSGSLHKGEGVLSLARGFIYSGSKSVVMSLWEVDDKSGTDIVKLFYRHLKNGDKKSEALRKARLEYLKSAGQLRSPPYFWSTLVVYGDDSPLYVSIYVKVILIVVPVLLIIGIVVYLRKRRYS